jgi:hypothetical protein
MNENNENGFIHIFKALADFQQECPVIHKGTTGYGYTYADSVSYTHLRAHETG